MSSLTMRESDQTSSRCIPAPELPALIGGKQCILTQRDGGIDWADIIPHNNNVPSEKVSGSVHNQCHNHLPC